MPSGTPQLETCPFCGSEMIEWDDVLRLWVCAVCARRWRIVRVAKNE